MYIQELWWADSWQDVQLAGNRINNFDFIDGHTGLRITRHSDWATLTTYEWARGDMWMSVNWMDDYSGLLDYFDLITDIARSLRRP
jgi:hypothetical protein